LHDPFAGIINGHLHGFRKSGFYCIRDHFGLSNQNQDVDSGQVLKLLQNIHRWKREDFFYRINVIPICIPPLRERMGDIPLLAEAFFRRIKLKSGKTIQGISNEALEILMKYPWPGNVRELKSVFEYAVVSCPGSMIAPEHLPPNIIKSETLPQSKEQPSLSLDEIKNERLLNALQKSRGNQSRAARILGISRTSVWNQVKRFNITL
jgi:transcriptional regulator with PAS, ATPase and Fis domain